MAAGFVIVAGVGAAPSEASGLRHTADPPKAWIDAKSVCLFRLGSGRMPQTPEELSAALADGWKQSITLPDPDKAVSIEGGYPAIGTLRIDLSDGKLHTGRRDKIRVNNRVEQDLQVNHLEVRGEPILLQTARLHMNLTADSARIDLERDRRGRPVMMLADAKSGTFSFDLSQADAEALLLRNAREAASPYGVTVERAQLKITPETPRSLAASLYIETRIAFLPAGMLFKAHVTVDDAMNARITGLTCDGDEALGPLIVGLLRPALQAYNGKTRPLLSFPSAALQLRDVAVRVDDSLHLTAAFGN